MKQTTYGFFYRVLLILLVFISGNVFSQTLIDSENFESGWGIWNDGGADCRLDNSSVLSGTYCLNLQADNGVASSSYTNDLNLTTYGSVTIDFDFRTSNYGWNHNFYIEFSNDSGATWHATPIATYTRNGSGFSNGTTYTGESVTAVNASYGGIYTFTANSRFRFRSSAPTQNWRDFYFDNVVITGYPPAPEINVQGNSTSIVDGDASPSPIDHTDFTIANAGTQITRTFTIQNVGTANLTISSIVLSNTTDFTIIAPFYATPVAFGGSTTFTIRYNALTLGTKTSTVTINNNDGDEAIYNFDIQARSEQNFFDSDGDGVYDNIDIDDDNDGIEDSGEELACQASSFSTTVNYKFLNETFGEGPSRATINTTYDAYTTYCYEDGVSSGCFGGIDVNDGEYTVYHRAADGDGTNDTPIDEVASWADQYWYTGDDHTPGDTDGRMAMFNASYDPGVFYTAKITGSLPNVPITYSFWVLNLDTTLAPGIATRLRPDILVEFRDVNDVILASLTTGDIPPSINGDPANSWHEFTANLTLNVTEFYVFFINNETGGAGNDLAIDDIVISQTLCDTDADGVADLFDLDADNDGIPDVVEAGLGAHSEGEATLTSIAAWVDANGNGMHDLIEGNIVLDSDSDGVPNYIDLDSDNDAIFDVDESGAGNTADPLYQNGDGDINGDGVGDGQDTDNFRETDVDSDGTLEYYTDGILDIYDYFNGGSYATGYGNSNQGLGSTYYVLDSDLDGSPDYMDTTSDGSTYDISHTLYASLDANNNGVIDDTNDAEGDGIVDLFDTDDTAFGSPRDLNRKLELYFDGRNDYIEDATVMGTWGEATLMGWIKIDPATSGSKIIMGQDNFYITLNADLSISATANGVTVTNGSALATNRWIHVGATYSNSNSLFKLYVNGLEVDSDAISGNLASDSSSFTIGRQPDTDSNYFMGYIDEAKIFAEALTDDEYQKNIYQEIEDNTQVRGTVIPRDITTLPWSDVSRYFRFDVYKDDITDDLTTAPIDTGTGAKMYNFKVIDYQTAPLPFVTQSSGVLSTAVDIPSDGVHGLDATTYDWSIVRVEHDNVTYNANQKHLGLFINELDAGTNPIEYHVQNDSELNVSWYLKLDGFIDLEGESQLVQGDDSMLDVTSKGYIERDQQGTADLYTYNYWAAPVGPTSIVSNNNDYALEDVLKDGTTASAPATITWNTSGYNGAAGPPIQIADYWIWKFADQLSDDYPSWQHVRSNNDLQPGEGYTMKGTTDTSGSIGTEQNYVFNGKPHNGDITLSLSSGNDYLIGNPYASAIDADEFILDNVSDGAGRAVSNIIDGSLYFWEHFASNTHILQEYQGGYGVYNLMGSTAAILSDTRINHTGGLSSSKGAPQQFIPVAQGFFVTADTGGTITFKNSQRIFKTEASDPSTFMRAAGSKKEKTNNSTTRSGNIDSRQKIRLMFDSPKGYHRELLLGADKNASALFDRGYDAPLIEDNVEDIFWTLEDKKFVIQGVENFSDNNVFPIGIKIDQDGEATIKIKELENIPNSLDVFINDKDLELIHDLNLMPYKVNLTAGEYLNRFEIVFNDRSFIIDSEKAKTINFQYSNTEESIIIFNPEFYKIETMAIINLLGQEVFTAKDIGSESYITLKPRKLSTGAYVIKATTEEGTITKKVIIE